MNSYQSREEREEVKIYFLSTWLAQLIFIIINFLIAAVIKLFNAVDNEVLIMKLIFF